jgi:uncharacterized membrane protein YphA (DoxX/SURF4 family)
MIRGVYNKMVKIRSSPSKPSNNRRALMRKTPRWFVGLVLVATGTGKALDIPGFVDVLAAYDLLPAWGNVILAYCMPFIELATGTALLADILLPLATWVAVGLHTLLLAAVSISLWRELEIANCGCFGVFWPRPLGVQTIVEDSVMLGLSLLVLWEARRTT